MCAPFHCATPFSLPEAEQLSALSSGIVLPSEIFLHEIASFRSSITATEKGLNPWELETHCYSFYFCIFICGLQAPFGKVSPYSSFLGLPMMITMFFEWWYSIAYCWVCSVLKCSRTLHKFLCSLDCLKQLTQNVAQVPQMKHTSKHSPWVWLALLGRILYKHQSHKGEAGK